MNESEWLTSSDPQQMLRYLIGADAPRVQAVEEFPDARGSDRKLRLFACACYYRISHLLQDLAARAAVHVAERFADGAASEAEFAKAETTVRELVTALEPRWRASQGAERIALRPTHAALALAGIVCWREPQKAAWYAASNAYLEFPYLVNPGVDVHSRERWESELSEKRAQCELLRDMFGNPFRSICFAPEWRTDTAVALARQMYECCDFAAMPTLADALEAAGCRTKQLLGHCHASLSHLRGCWVVDLLLGKE
jgi:hypothetical protein